MRRPVHVRAFAPSLAPAMPRPAAQDAASLPDLLNCLSKPFLSDVAAFAVAVGSLLCAVDNAFLLPTLPTSDPRSLAEAAVTSTLLPEGKANTKSPYCYATSTASTTLLNATCSR